MITGAQMAHFDSILITYHNKDRILFQIYAEFFRLMGIYITEDILYDQKIQAADIHWNEMYFSFHYKIRNTSKMNGIGSEAEVKEQLTVLKEELKAHIHTDAFFECYDDICNIFCENQLFRASAILQYYKSGSEKTLTAGEQFEHAADSLTQLLNKKNRYLENRYARYASLYCKQKANSARYICKQRVIYYVDKLASQGLALCKEFDGFSNAWVLLGLICEKSKDFLPETINAYQRAVQMTGYQPYASSIYYLLGKCYEFVDDTISIRAAKEYENAYKCMKKYRNIYKMAISYNYKNEWEEAVHYFYECLQFLKWKDTFLDPIEQEYYFKVNTHLSYYYLRQENFCDAIKYAKRALELYQKLKDGIETENPETAFYISFFGKDAGQYIHLALKKMNEQQTNQYLSVAYLELQMQEEAVKNLAVLES